MRLLKCVTSTLVVFLVAAATNSVGVVGCGDDDSGDGAVSDTLRTFEGDVIVQTRYTLQIALILCYNLQGTKCALPGAKRPRFASWKPVNEVSEVIIGIPTEVSFTYVVVDRPNSLLPVSETENRQFFAAGTRG